MTTVHIPKQAVADPFAIDARSLFNTQYLMKQDSGSSSAWMSQRQMQCERQVESIGEWIIESSRGGMIDPDLLRTWKRALKHSPAAATPAVAQPLSTGAMLDFCMTALSLNITAISNLLGISRPTFYAWHDNAVGMPDSQAHARLVGLVDALRDAGISADQPIHKRLVVRPLEGETESLFDLLRQADANQRRLPDYLRRVHAASQQIEAETRQRRNQTRRRTYLGDAENGLTSLEWDNL